MVIYLCPKFTSTILTSVGILQRIQQKAIIFFFLISSFKYKLVKLKSGFTISPQIVMHLIA